MKTKYNYNYKRDVFCSLFTLQEKFSQTLTYYNLNE
jgi:hypothetical protein